MVGVNSQYVLYDQEAKCYIIYIYEVMHTAMDSRNGRMASAQQVTLSELKGQNVCPNAIFSF